MRGRQIGLPRAKRHRVEKIVDDRTGAEREKGRRMLVMIVCRVSLRDTRNSAIFQISPDALNLNSRILSQAADIR